MRANRRSELFVEIGEPSCRSPFIAHSFVRQTVYKRAFHKGLRRVEVESAVLTHRRRIDQPQGPNRSGAPAGNLKLRNAVGTDQCDL